jgi:glycine/D-amino acid oxidase-like deaminating enzyme
MPVIETIHPSTEFPDRAGAVVIGAGIIGIMTALELADRGIDVVVVEKGEVAAEQSSRNWGWCRQMGRDPREIPLALLSLTLWRGMNARIGAETGWTQCGITYLCDTATDLAKKEAWHRDHAAPHGLKTRMVRPEEIAQLLPGCIKTWVGGIHTSDDGRAEPFIAVPAMARALLAKGGKVFTRCAARGLETAGGRVSSVVTEKGVIATDTVVLAGGYWSKRFLNNLDIRFPQLGVVNSVMRTAPLETGITQTFSGNRFAVRKRLDGGFTVAHNHFSVAEVTPASFEHFFDFLPALKLERKSIRVRVGKRFVEEVQLRRKWKLDDVTPFEQVRVLDPAPYDDVISEASDALKQWYPAFANMQIADRWGGMIDSTPDTVPVIDAIAKLPGLYLASGFSGHGFGIGPGAGKLMADIVTGAKPCVDPQPFRYSRFIDGTRAKPVTGV